MEKLFRLACGLIQQTIGRKGREFESSFQIFVNGAGSGEDSCGLPIVEGRCTQASGIQKNYSRKFRGGTSKTRPQVAESFRRKKDHSGIQAKKSARKV